MFISIDPGIRFCGVSILESKKDKLKVHETTTIVGTRKIRDPKLADLAKRYGDRTGRVFKIKEVVEDLLEKYPNIKEIVMEAPFFNRFSPVAFAALLEVLHILKYEVIIPKDLKFAIIEPRTVKKWWTGSGNAKKEAMKETLVEKVKNKSVVIDTDVEELSEHVIDSIAVGYTFDAMKKEGKLELEG